MTRPRIDVLLDQLRDERSRQVVFLSHCLLNENTRYLGGACRRCCVREVVEQCMEREIGMVQMPCPEQQVWGGVLKRRMIRFYGAGLRGALPGGAAAALLPVALRYVRWRFRRIARRVADEIADYVRSGFDVVGIVGVDGSPTCGVGCTVDLGGCARDVALIDPAELTVRDHNDLVHRHAVAGHGLFIDELARELARRHLDVPFLAHDLFAELEGRTSRLDIGRRPGAAVTK